MVILWLVVRGAALLYSAPRTGAARNLGRPCCSDRPAARAGLLAGLPVALLVYGLFGPTPQIVAKFAWVFAASFIATGALLLAIARIGEAPRSTVNAGNRRLGAGLNPSGARTRAIALEQAVAIVSLLALIAPGAAGAQTQLNLKVTLTDLDDTAQPVPGQRCERPMPVRSSSGKRR